MTQNQNNEKKFLSLWGNICRALSSKPSKKDLQSELDDLRARFQQQSLENTINKEMITCFLCEEMGISLAGDLLQNFIRRLNKYSKTAVTFPDKKASPTEDIEYTNVDFNVVEDIIIFGETDMCLDLTTGTVTSGKKPFIKLRMFDVEKMPAVRVAVTERLVRDLRDARGQLLKYNGNIK